MHAVADLFPQQVVVLVFVFQRLAGLAAALLTCSARWIIWKIVCLPLSRMTNSSTCTCSCSRVSPVPVSASTSTIIGIITACQLRRISDSVPSKSNMAALNSPRGKSGRRISIGRSLTRIQTWDSSMIGGRGGDGQSTQTSFTYTANRGRIAGGPGRIRQHAHVSV